MIQQLRDCATLAGDPHADSHVFRLLIPGATATLCGCVEATRHEHPHIEAKH